VSVWSEQWSWEPQIVIPLVILLVVYAVGAARRGHFHTLRWRHASFFAGWTSLSLALTSPIHELGEQLFSAHMLQHEIMILVSAPLISASQPGATCLWAFAPWGRARIGARLHRIERMQLVRFLSAPLSAWLLEALALWLWHIPALYQATLESNWIHAEQHLSFFLTAVIFWSALYGVGRSALSYGAGTFYTFGAAVQCSALGALLTFSSVVWYPAYAKTTARWGLTPLEDQQLGGVIMWVPSAIAFMVIALALFSKWLNESECRLKLGTLAAVLQEEERT
jgi:cytochrome c oxidase assembly factor CtaG